MGTAGEGREVAGQRTNFLGIFFVRQGALREAEQHRQFTACLNRELSVFLRSLVAEPDIKDLVQEHTRHAERGPDMVTQKIKAPFVGTLTFRVTFI